MERATVITAASLVLSNDGKQSLHDWAKEWKTIHMLSPQTDLKRVEFQGMICKFIKCINDRFWKQK
jgi:hypothetical protein